MAIMFSSLVIVDQVNIATLSDVTWTDLPVGFLKSTVYTGRMKRPVNLSRGFRCGVQRRISGAAGCHGAFRA
jgi:hypothetical protein